MAFLSSKQRIAGLFAAAMFALLVVAAANMAHFYHFQDAMNSVINTQRVLEDAAQLLSSVKSAETGQRGYLLTGRDSYLAPFKEGQVGVWIWFDALNQATRDNPAHQQTLAAVKPLLVQKLDELSATIELRKSGRASAADAIVHTDAGRDWMNEITAELDDLEKRERNTFETRNRHLQLETTRRWWFTLFGSLFSILLLSWMYYLLAHESGARLEAIKALERKEQELQKHASELASTNKELEAFCYSVSHDLRAPLRGIEGFSRVVAEKYKNVLDAEGLSYLDRVRNGVKRMGQLIDELLRLSRITRVELRPETLNLADVARGVAADLNQSQPERSVEWVIPETMTVQGDPNLLKIALENLFSNAWKFTGNQPKPRIELGTQMTTEGIVYFSRDNGAGFDMAYKDKLFSAFQRLHTPAEFPGLGIGLATVQRVIHRHGGRIWAEGEVDRGATFYFTLA